MHTSIRSLPPLTDYDLTIHIALNCTILKYFAKSEF